MAATTVNGPQQAAAHLAANASVPVHMHPVALRSTTNATSSRSAAASMLAEATLRGQHNSGDAPTSPPPTPVAPLPPSPTIIPCSPPPACALPPLPDTPPPCPTPRAGKSPVPALSPRHASLHRPSLSRQVTPRKEPKLGPVAGLQVDHAKYPFLRIREAPASSSVSRSASSFWSSDSDSDSDEGPWCGGRNHRRSATPSPPPQERQTSIRLITAEQLVELQTRYQASASIADETVVFPWLHCCDQAGTPQANYFASAHGAKGSTAPRYRGLTLVSADPDCPRISHSRKTSLTQFQRQLSRHERERADSIGSRSTASTSSLESAVSSLFDTSLSLGSPQADPTGSGTPSSSSSPTESLSGLLGNEPRASLLTSSLLPEDILARTAGGVLMPQFATPRLPANVNLRLFKHQPARYASVSDVVVYSEHGLAESAVVLAEKVRAAQDRCRRERERAAWEEGHNAASVVEYATYIVTDRFEEFEKRFPDLVAVDGWGFRRNRVDFFEREREEMVGLTKASEIATNVWLGNSNDVPLPAQEECSSRPGLTTSDSSSSLATTIGSLDDGNHHAFSICIEAHDNAVMPCRQILDAHAAHIESVERDLYPTATDPEPYADYKPTLHCDDDGKALRPHVADVAHLEVVSTAQICTTRDQQAFLVDSIVDLCAWVSRMAKPEGSQDLAKRVLIHCHDGYTETSLFALSYTMWDRGCSLPDAYLHLQLARERSFFVYPADVQLLQRIEAKVLAIHAERKVTLEAEKMDIDEPVPVPPPSPAKSGFLRNRYSFGLSSKQSAPSTPVPTPAPSPVPMTPREQHPWFFDERFDGHFPSRILPFLYLGNLNHASNALMLRALGITHVVSMGESALIPPKNATSLLGRPRTGPNGGLVQNSLWHEHKAGRIQVLDMKNVADDGIDSIRPHIDRAMAFIEECRQSGGKVLVHCRVGVSRSATIVIAYVMKHLKMDLTSAYLMVRSRRLNILIQPNLLFMWALRKLEADLVEKEAEPSLKAQWNAKKLSWSHFAREVACLNHRYLC